MSLAYQRASRPYKRLVFDDFTFLPVYIFVDNFSVWGLLLGSFVIVVGWVWHGYTGGVST